MPRPLEVREVRQWGECGLTNWPIIVWKQEDIMQATATETFIGNMRGPVIRRRDAEYDAVRSLYNGMIDKSPEMIARCTDVC